MQYKSHGAYVTNGLLPGIFAHHTACSETRSWPTGLTPRQISGKQKDKDKYS